MNAYNPIINMQRNALGIPKQTYVRKYSVRLCALSSFAQMPNKGEPDKH